MFKKILLTLLILFSIIALVLGILVTLIYAFEIDPLNLKTQIESYKEIIFKQENNVNTESNKEPESLDEEDLIQEDITKDLKNPRQEEVETVEIEEDKNIEENVIVIGSLPYDKDAYEACLIEYENKEVLDEGKVYLSFEVEYDLKDINLFMSEKLSYGKELGKEDVGYEKEVRAFNVPLEKEIEYACKLKNLNNSIFYQIEIITKNISQNIDINSNLNKNSNINLNTNQAVSTTEIEKAPLNTDEEMNTCFYLAETSKKCQYKMPLMEKGRDYYEDFSSYEPAYKALIDLDYALEDDDEDGMSNFYELVRHTDLTSKKNSKINFFELSAEYQEVDKDFDGLKDIYEEVLGLSADDPDTDHDGYEDGAEIALGYDPLVPAGEIEHEYSTFIDWKNNN